MTLLKSFPIHTHITCCAKKLATVFINSPSEDEEAVVVGSAVAEGHKGVRTTMKAKTIEASVACLFN